MIFAVRFNPQGAVMKKPKNQYVVNLEDWSLPQTEDLEHDLIHALIAKICKASLGIGQLGPGRLSEQIEKREEQLYELLHSGIRKLAEALMNETVDIWLKGLGDGYEGKYPQFCVEFPIWKALQRSNR